MLKTYYKIWERNSGIKITERSLNGDVQKLLADLFGSRISADLKEFFPPTHDVLHNDDDTEEAVVVDNGGSDHAIEQDEVTPPIHVPPLQAIQQVSYIVSHNSTASIPPDARRCAWYPKCLELQPVCKKGTRLWLCNNMKHHPRARDADFIGEMKREKKEAKRQRDAMIKMQQRAKEKRRRVS